MEIMIVLFFVLLVFFIISIIIIKKCTKSINTSEEIKDRYFQNYQICNKWLNIIEENKDVSDFFKKNNINKISIYGMGEMGIRLYNGLKDSDIEVTYLIDRIAEHVYKDIKGIQHIRKEVIPSNNLYKTIEDVFLNGSKLINPKNINPDNEFGSIVVTPVYAYKDIKEMLINSGVKAQIISLKDILDNI